MSKQLFSTKQSEMLCKGLYACGIATLEAAKNIRESLERCFDKKDDAK